MPNRKTKRKSPVSLCLIVRNEAGNLGECLADFCPLADEIVVVDTGSQDATIEIARKFTPNVLQIPWNDSFSEARNTGIRHANGQYILLADADDRIDAENRRRLNELLADLDSTDLVGAFTMTQRSSYSQTSLMKAKQLRMFRRLPNVQFERRVHEQLTPSLFSAGLRLEEVDIVINHFGYDTKEKRLAKSYRNLRLLLLDRNEGFNDAVTAYNLGRTYAALGEWQNAVANYHVAWGGKRTAEENERYIFDYVTALIEVGQLEFAIKCCRWFQSIAGLTFSVSALELDAYRLSEDRYKLLQKAHELQGYVGEQREMEEHERLSQSLVRSGIYLQRLKQFEAALPLHALSITFQPRSVTAWRALGEAALFANRFDEVYRAVRYLRALNAHSCDAFILEGRAFILQRDWRSAHSVLSAAYQLDSRNSTLLLLLAQSEYCQGHPEVAENLLKSVLDRDPNNLDAVNMLDLVKRLSSNRK